MSTTEERLAETERILKDYRSLYRRTWGETAPPDWDLGWGEVEDEKAFVFDPYGDFGPSNAQDAFEGTDSEKLNMIAEWFDRLDEKHGVVGATAVQDDLRRIAEALVADTDAVDGVTVGDWISKEVVSSLPVWSVVRAEGDRGVLVLVEVNGPATVSNPWDRDYFAEIGDFVRFKVIGLGSGEA